MRQDTGADTILWTQTETVSATMSAACAFMQMRMEMAFVITIYLVRAADAETAFGADAETAFGADAADKQKEPLCEANRRQSEPSKGIPILSGGYVQYI